MVIVLLPGMDGSGMLFEPFVRLLPDHLDVRVVRYPPDKYLSYSQLTEYVLDVVPRDEPYFIIAESYSGPIAVLLAARGIGNLQAVVFVFSFVCPPLGRFGLCMSKVIPAAVFRVGIPCWILRGLLMDSAASAELVTAVQIAVMRVKPEVLVQRLREALEVDLKVLLRNCTTRIVYLLPGSDCILGVRALRGFIGVKPEIDTVEIPGPTFSFNAHLLDA